MKKISGLLLILLLASCGNSREALVSSAGVAAVAGDPAAEKVTAQSILAEAGKNSYKDGELIVKYKPGIRSASSLRLEGTLGTRKMKEMPLLNAERVRLPDGLSVRDAISLYMQDPDVEYAEPNYLRSARATVPNDPLFSAQWALSNRLVPGADMHMPQAWDVVSGGSGLVIAVVDTGIDYTHPDLARNIWSNPGDSDCASGSDNDHNGFVADCRGWNFVGNNNDPMDDDGHGTHVSGIIGAAGNNSIGIAGVLWNVKLMPLKILDATGEGTVADEASAIEYAIAKGAKVINASFAGDTFSYTESAAIAAANAAGVLFITAAGNGGTGGSSNNDVTPVYPGNYDLPNIIAVAATDERDRLASFSNYGNNTVHVAAPGVDILSTVPSALTRIFCGASPASGYEFCDGTSMSTAHVTGLAGLLESYYPDFSYGQVRATIMRYVDLLPTLQGLTASGGRVNAYKALSSLMAPDGLSAAAESSSAITLNWTDRATGEDGYVIERKAPGGVFSEIDRVGADVTTYLDSKGLLASTMYAYRVSAFNTIPALSQYSNEATATTAEAPQPPPSSSSGGGGGCSVAARGTGSAADALVFVIPVLAVYIRRRLRGRKK